MSEDPVRYWRQGRAYVLEHPVPLPNTFHSPTLFSWELAGPGIYRSQADPTQRRRLMVENSFSAPGIDCVQVDPTNDLWNVSALGCTWKGVERSTMIGIEDAVVDFFTGLFAKAKAIAAQKQADREHTPAPAPPPAEDGSGGLPS